MIQQFYDLHQIVNLNTLFIHYSPFSNEEQQQQQQQSLYDCIVFIDFV